MKKLLLITFLFPLLLNAQRMMQKYHQLNMLNYDPENNFYDEQSAPLKLRKQAGIKEITVYNSSKRGKQYTSHMIYNGQGRLLRSANKWQTIENTYESDTLLVESVSARKGKIYKTSSTFSNGKLASRESSKNGKMKSKITLNHNAQGKITMSELVKKNKTYEIIYAYDNENKLTRTVYSINGKVKKEWIYECKPEGQVVASKTEEISSVCSYREESADGSYTKFTRSLQEGKPYLFKQRYNKDSVMISSQRFLNDSILIWESQKENNVETVSAFKESGKRWYLQISTYNDQGSLLSREYFHGNKNKSQTKSVFELNADGTTKTRSFYWKGKLEYSARFEYTFF